VGKIGQAIAGVVRCSGPNGWRDVIITMGRYGLCFFCRKNQNHRHSCSTMVISDLELILGLPRFSSSDRDSKSAIVYGLAVNDPRPRKKKYCSLKRYCYLVVVVEGYEFR